MSHAEPLLVTGGAGFLGRHLARHYAAAGCAVTVLDDLSNPSSRFDHPELEHPRIRRVRGSIGDERLVAELVDAHPVIIHFASIVGVGATIDQPLVTARNLTGTLHVVERVTPRHTLVFGSSADVYGMHSRMHDRPMREDDDVVFEHAGVNRWVYPKIKAVEENAVAASAARSVSVRIFNSVGPGMDFPDARRVVPRFLQAILERTPLQVNGSGRQLRCFADYTDTVDGVTRALAFARAREPGPAGVFNVGNDEPVSVADLAHLMVRLAVEEGVLDEPLPVEHVSGGMYSQPFDDEWHRVPDLSRAAQVLGYRPRVAMEDALRRTLRGVAPLVAG